MPEAETRDHVADAPAVAPGWSMRRRAAALLGLSSIAVTQPLLDLFGRNPEFFVVGRYSRWQIVVFALAIAVVPAAVATAVTAVAARVDRRAGDIVFVVAVGVFGAAIVLAVLRSAGVDSTALVAVLALLGAAAVVGLVVFTVAGRLLASYVALAAVAFVGLFLFASPASELVLAGHTANVGSVDLDAPAGPVVWIILDEFPVASILDGAGEINADRYPGFAELASVTTWYRNASSTYNNTHRAVPDQLTGVISPGQRLPRYQDYPRNVFTFFGDVVPIHRYESVTDMCPPTVCDPPPPQPLSQAFQDAAVVYGHRVLPSTLRDDLPSIDTSWGDFGAETDTVDVDPADMTRGELIDAAYERWRSMGADEKSPLGQAGVLAERIEAIGPEPAFHFVHVALPHRPWVLSASGLTSSFSPELITEPDAPGYLWGTRLDFQQSALQIGAADRLMSQLVEHLRALPDWDQTTLIVTSDHGTNLTPPDLGRTTVTDANREEVYRVPLFVKWPGASDGGERSDEHVQTIDILPSLVDALDADVDWTFDGHSLLDGSEPTAESKVSTSVQPLLDVAARRAEEFPYGTDWTALAAVGPNGDLVGAEVADLTAGEPSPLDATLDQADLFASLPTREGTAPFVLSGTVSTEPAGDLVVAVNGRIAGVVGGYRPVDGGFAFDGFVGDVYRTGANEVALYEVTRDGTDPVLHPIG